MTTSQVLQNLNRNFRIARTLAGKFDENDPANVRRHQRIEVAATFISPIFNLDSVGRQIKDEKVGPVSRLINSLLDGTFSDDRPLGELLDVFPELREELLVLLEHVNEGYVKAIPFFPCLEYTDEDQDKWPLKEDERDVREYVESEILINLMSQN